MDNIFEYYADVEPVPVEWLWYPYIPFGKLTFLQGDPGEGKSTFAVRLAALLSSGRSLPGDSSTSQPLSIIYQCGEDGIADTVKPRLVEAQADCGRMVHILEDSDMLTLEDCRIAETIRATGARLVIIDPIQAYISGDGDMQNAVRMRRILKSLANVAEDTEAAILLIGHMNKNSYGKSLYRGLGSIDMAAIARSVLMLVRDPKSPDFRYVFHIKSNLAPEGLPIGFRFDRKGFRWLGICDVSLEELLGNKPSDKEGKKPEAIALLQEILAAEGRPCSEVLEQLASKGIAKRTAMRAKQALGITSYRKAGAWYWCLDRDTS